MKNRPAKWQDLPYSIREQIADNCDLVYDSYESSHAEALNNVLLDSGYYYYNDEIVQERYEQISDDEFKKMIKNNLESLKNQAKELEEYLE